MKFYKGPILILPSQPEEKKEKRKRVRKAKKKPLEKVEAPVQVEEKES